ncbi:immunoglobulin-like domain-containing protein [Sellimonas catena]|uniref:Pesticidal crystal protein Cry22Aa Ig-like domain-containing protein n=1 Tax=Sellimonas catena TaxID=2994035 RepID=A0A9W6C961_9FIRM|nr:immunoglobulin-like domain-containing protein [Sellimonas catena]GLG06102.1 hypothetical protein Selli1_32760 [Sellimonas catena]
MRIIRTILVICSIVAFGAFIISEVIQLGSRDTTKPQITAETDTIEVTSEYTREELMEGIRAWDEKEGDLTAQVVFSSPSRFIEKGVCNVTYAVFDSSGQSASLTRKIKFADYHSPQFTLSQPLVFVEGEGSSQEVMSRLGAQDVLDGSRKDWIVQKESDVNYQFPGTYSITFEVENSYGDSVSESLPVHVVSADSQQMSITLSTGIVYITAGQEIDPKTYITGVTGAGGENIDTDKVSISSGVNPNVPGCYEVHYQVKDDQGSQGETWLTVIVEDGGED